MQVRRRIGGSSGDSRPAIGAPDATPDDLPHRPGPADASGGLLSRRPVLLGAQLLFNLGFYGVVPFIALVLSDDFALAGAAVGLVLGVRTFAQQGMFLAGGVLTDRFGARGIILTGCLVRTAGFGTLAAALWQPVPSLPLFVAGTVLTGLGGALFSPALSTLVAAADAGSPRRVTLFAWLTVTGEIGATIGPLLGGVLLGWGFATVAAAGAGLFAAIGTLLWWALPEATTPPRRGPGNDPWASLRDRRFAAFCALHAVDLLAYNQLYLTLPLELRRAGGGTQALALLFAWVSVLTLALQLPLARWCARIGPPAALRAGYLTTAAGFGVLAAGALVLPDGSPWLTLIAASLLILGHLTVQPTAMSTVPAFAGGLPTGSFYGLLASLGGVAVLLGNLVAGSLFEGAGPWPWLFLAGLPVISALLMPRVVRQPNP